MLSAQTIITNPDGSLDVIPDPRSLDEIKVAALAALADRRWRAAAAMPYGDRTGVACDDTAQNRLNNTIRFLELAGAPAETVVGWEMLPGDYQNMTKADLETFGVAMGMHVQACWQRQRVIAAQIAEAADVDAVYAIDLETGWP